MNRKKLLIKARELGIKNASQWNKETLEFLIEQEQMRKNPFYENMHDRITDIYELRVNRLGNAIMDETRDHVLNYIKGNPSLDLTFPYDDCGDFEISLWNYSESEESMVEVGLPSGMLYCCALCKAYWQAAGGTGTTPHENGNVICGKCELFEKYYEDWKRLESLYRERFHMPLYGAWREGDLELFICSRRNKHASKAKTPT